MIGCQVQTTLCGVLNRDVPCILQVFVSRITYTNLLQETTPDLLMLEVLMMLTLLKSGTCSEVCMLFSACETQEQELLIY